MRNNNFSNLSVRKACLKSLVNYEKDKKYSNIELSKAVDKYDFNDLDRSFFTRLFYGVIEKKLTLDYHINFLCDKNKKIDSELLNILRMGIYQILYMEKVPDNAACSESVELAKSSAKSQNPKAAGFVNAVLRNFIRRKDECIENIEKIEQADKRLEIKYSCSYDIIKIWKESYGIEIAEKILAASELATNTPNITITVNSLKISRDKYIEELKAQDINIRTELIELTELSEYGINISGNMPIRHIRGFNDGLFFVQDEASQVCAAETGAKAGDLIVDCCAAPGGKSFFMAQMMNNMGRIICFDVHKNKLNLISQSAKRLGIDIIEAYEHDAAEFSDVMKDLKADVVLCDVPCSGLGVVHKKPEIKYKPIAEINKLPELQYKILETCSGYVKPGGILVYSTCTLNKKENEEITEKFLNENKRFKCEKIKTFFPFERKIDGFFLAKMRLDGV